MSRVWQLQEAKSRFSEVVDKALSEGPQKVTRRGRDAVVVLSITDYKKLSRTKGHFVERYRKFAGSGPELDIKRISEYPREIEL